MRKLLMMALSVCFCSAAVAQNSAPASESAATTEEAIPTETSDNPLDFWMQKKLDYSTGILRGLSTGDFQLIEINAKQMRLLNKIEGFVRSRHEGYRGHVRSFGRVTDEVIRQAQRENIEGVTLAFHQLTVSCVRCHQSLREADGDVYPDSPDNAAQNHADEVSQHRGGATDE